MQSPKLSSPKQLYSPRKAGNSTQLSFWPAQSMGQMSFVAISPKLNGLGGNCSSLSVKKERIQPTAPKANVFSPLKSTTVNLFKKYYDRGDLPIAVNSSGAHRKVQWKLEPQLLDFHLYLPIFFEGLRETQEPYKFLSLKGCEELLELGGSKILPVLPQLIIPIKKALGTKNQEVICNVLKMLQKLIKSNEMIGEAMVPYYRQILPILNLFSQKHLNLGDKIDYSQRKKENLGELIQETLELFERHGGEDAYINIKYMIPTYESCMF